MASHPRPSKDLGDICLDIAINVQLLLDMIKGTKYSVMHARMNRTMTSMYSTPEPSWITKLECASGLANMLY